MTTPLADKIKAIISVNGPISVTDYFALCLADPEHGYYKTRDPFGRGGDFVTAPEVSQLFGEMIGVFLVEAWRKHLRPSRNLRIAEIGPGRGTMMADILRTVRQLAPELYDAATVHLVETSPALRSIQQTTLASHSEKLAWHESFDTIPPGFLLFVANEFFDAVPIRQFVKTANGFRERLVGVDERENLAFAAGVTGVDPALLPAGHQAAAPGTIAEVAPARMAIMQLLSDRLFDAGGTALIIDYGHLATGLGDTLQAVFKHTFDPPLAHPGEADLTSHVDFQSLAEIARSRSIAVNGLMTQGEFLLKLGLLERAGALGRGKSPKQQAEIQAAVERLAGTAPNQMGELFKVMSVSSPDVQLAQFID
ncbi:class I SAM-dependent methyltransferase [Rhizobium sp. TH2]|uniref:class I SAM-dependent methyltransferase n=1 Tax=Rhizobium sp. TH2 TaxID=2775403 RepID=UPI0021578D2D|nr:class I SAM-dependent methyltransferase [Rhizobium sp. TH2]UVC07053.1 class I SAM-dependent methyltransferase [Rhizobium sp. TH2]